MSDLKFTKQLNKKHRRGRGIGSGRGAKSGKGQKGQKARSGGRKRTSFEGGQTPLFRRIPKLRGVGYKNPRDQKAKPKMAVVNLLDLNQKFEDGDTVTPKALLRYGLVDTIKFGVKILGNGELKKKLKFKDVFFSKSVKSRIK
ncbi:MAG: 50S ribosomal protein L15 [uncultured bacterium]|nr:MAG: 50S ribosomal protein L15 [uncultured bacterium]